MYQWLQGVSAVLGAVKCWGGEVLLGGGEVLLGGGEVLLGVRCCVFGMCLRRAVEWGSRNWGLEGLHVLEESRRVTLVCAPGAALNPKP